MILRRYLPLFILVLSSALGVTQADEPKRKLGQAITVYKSPYCGCCTGWIEYLKSNGFEVTVVEQHDLSDLKAKYGIRPKLQSCHTAIVDGYAIEGHVPVDDIWKLLDERPNVTGLTAPGMPQMSPGMSSIEPKGYDVLSFDRNGRTEVFSRY